MNSRRSRLVLLVVSLEVGSLVGPGRAAAGAGCPLIDGSSSELGSIDAATRLRFLERGLASGARKARRWAWSWAAVHSTAIAYDIVSGLWLTPNGGGRVDGLIGAAASTLGLATLVIRPLPVMRDQRWLERAMRHGTTAASETELCPLLAEAERRLLRDARAEAFGHSALVHVINFGFNIGVGLILGAGFGHWEQAAISALGGTALAELQTITQPALEVELLRRYRAAELRLPGAETSTAWTLAPAIGAGRWGVSLLARW